MKLRGAWVYLISCVGACGNGALSDQQAAAEIPDDWGLTAGVGNLTWPSLTLATSYNLYVRSDVNIGAVGAPGEKPLSKDDEELANVTSPFSEADLSCGVGYLVGVSAVLPAGESEIRGGISFETDCSQ